MADFPVPWYAFVIAFLVIYLLATLHILREYQRGRDLPPRARAGSRQGTGADLSSSGRSTRS